MHSPKNEPSCKDFDNFPKQNQWTLGFWWFLYIGIKQVARVNTVSLKWRQQELYFWNGNRRINTICGSWSVCVHEIFVCHYIICPCQYLGSPLAHLDLLDKLPMMNSRQTASSLMCSYGIGTLPIHPWNNMGNSTDVFSSGTYTVLNPTQPPGGPSHNHPTRKYHTQTHTAWRINKNKVHWQGKQLVVQGDSVVLIVDMMVGFQDFRLTALKTIGVHDMHDTGIVEMERPFHSLWVPSCPIHLRFWQYLWSIQIFP